MAAPPPPAPPKSFPYDHLFKLLMIGDAGVGKVSSVSKRSDFRIDYVWSLRLTWEEEFVVFFSSFFFPLFCV